MLVLRRNEQEWIHLYIGDVVIKLVVTQIECTRKRKAVRLGFDAPQEVNIVRAEVDTHD